MTDHGENRQHIGDLTPGTIALVRDVSDASAEKAVANAFRVIGFDLQHPAAAQELFVAMRKIVKRLDDEDERADRDWTRRTRKRSEGMIGKAFATAAGVAVLGGVHAMWAGIKTFIPALALLLILPSPAGAEWKAEYAQASPEVRAWYREAELTDAAKQRFPYKKCCDHADVFRTQFKTWMMSAGISFDKHAPDNQPTLFIYQGKETCFFPGGSGI